LLKAFCRGLEQFFEIHLFPIMQVRCFFFLLLEFTVYLSQMHAAKAQDLPVHAMSLRSMDSLEYARRLQVDGQLEQAKNIFKRFYQKYPGDKDVLYGLALIAEEQMDYFLALRYFNELEAWEHRFPEMFFDRGLVRYRLEQYEAALGDFIMAGQMPSRETRSINFKSVRYSQGAEKELVNIFSSRNWQEECLQWEIRCLIALKRGVEANARIEAAVRSSNDPIAWRELQFEYLRQQGDNANAAHVLREILKIDPDNRVAAFNLLELESEKLDTKSSTEGYESLLAMSPDFVEAYVNLAINHYKAGDYIKSITVLNEAIKKGDVSGKAYYNRGLAKLKLGKAIEAESDFRFALSLLGHHAPSFGGLGSALIQQERYLDAMEALQVAHSLNEEDIIYVFNLGHASYKAKKLPEACAYFQKAAAMGSMEARQLLLKLCR